MKLDLLFFGLKDLHIRNQVRYFPILENNVYIYVLLPSLTTGFRGVVVITSALHTLGPQFEPR